MSSFRSVDGFNYLNKSLLLEMVFNLSKKFLFFRIAVLK